MFKKISNYCFSLILSCFLVVPTYSAYSQNLSGESVSIFDFALSSEISCNEVARRYDYLLNFNFSYVSQSTQYKDFFSSKKISKAVISNIFLYLDHNNMFFSKKEILKLQKNQPLNIIQDLQSGNCEWYYSIFKKYELNVQVTHQWYKNIKKSKNTQKFLIHLFNILDSQFVSQIKRQLNKEWGDISLKEIEEVASTTLPKDTFKYIQTFSAFELTKIMRFYYNKLKKSNPKWKDNKLLKKTFSYIESQVFSDLGVRPTGYKNQTYLGVLVYSLDAHSLYSRKKVKNNLFNNGEDDFTNAGFGKVKGQLLNGAAYIKIPIFYSGSEGSAVDDFIQILKILDPSSDALILDLRNNTGGSFAQSLHILSSLFLTTQFAKNKSCGQDPSQTKNFYSYLPTGVLLQNLEGKKPIYYMNIVSTLKKVSNSTAMFFCNAKPYFYKKPIVVLINEASASSAEIVALGLQDAGVAIVAGSARSFGKGSMQTNGRNLYLTESTWGSFLGNSIQAIGVKSDIVLNFPQVLKANKNLVLENKLLRSLPNIGSLPSVWFGTKEEEGFLNFYKNKKNLQKKKYINFLSALSQKRQQGLKEKMDNTKNNQEELMLKEVLNIIKDWKGLNKSLKVN